MEEDVKTQHAEDVKSPQAGQAVEVLQTVRSTFEERQDDWVIKEVQRMLSWRFRGYRNAMLAVSLVRVLLVLLIWVPLSTHLNVGGRYLMAVVIVAYLLAEALVIFYRLWRARGVFEEPPTSTVGSR